VGQFKILEPGKYINLTETEELNLGTLAELKRVGAKGVFMSAK